jgi:hypothetical protein
MLAKRSPFPLQGDHQALTRQSWMCDRPVALKGDRSLKNPRCPGLALTSEQISQHAKLKR